MKKIIILVLALMLILSGCGNDATTEAPTEKSEPAKSIKVTTVQKKQLTESVKLSGDIIANNSEIVSSMVSGKIMSIDVNIGDVVKKGDIIARLDTEFINLQAQQAKIDHDLSKINLATAKRNHARTKALYEEGAVTQADYEASSDMVAKARLACDSSKNRTAQMNYQLKYMTITAPIDGCISQILQQNGSSISTGMPICEIVNTEDVIVLTGVSETQVNYINTNQVVNIEVPALEKSFAGTVETISPVSDRNKTYPVRIKIDNKDGKLRAGMFAQLDINTTNSHDVLAIPKISVVSEQGEDYVFIVEENRAIRKTVQLGATFDKYFEVKGGISNGDTLVISGQNYLANDDLVEILK